LGAKGEGPRGKFKEHPEHGTRRNAFLLVDVDSLQQAANFLIMKELMNLVFTGNVL
jgi:hypothetical protein